MLLDFILNALLQCYLHTSRPIGNALPSPSLSTFYPSLSLTLSILCHIYVSLNLRTNPYKKEDYFLCPKSMPHKGYLNWRSLDYFLIRDFFSVN